MPKNSYEDPSVVTYLFDDINGDWVEHVFDDHPEDGLGLLHVGHQLVGGLQGCLGSRVLKHTQTQRYTPQLALSQSCQDSWKVIH